MSGGGLTYTVSAWVSLQLLRRSGCELPVELWFFRSELPDAPFRAALALHGASCRVVEDAIGDQAVELMYAGGAGKPYALKAAAVLLSRFREVLFLDADNMPLVEPSFLFDHAAYTRSGILLWPDFWPASTAPDFYNLTGLDPRAGPAGSHESGQMVFDKERAWRPLLLALWYNLQGALYYLLLSDFMGQGDKETFALACHALGHPVSVIARPVGAVGVVVRYDPHAKPKRCEPYPVGPSAEPWCFVGNSMAQHSPAGDLLFVHTNLPKWMLKARIAH